MEELDLVLLERVRKDFFRDSTLVQIGPSVEGYKLVDKAFVLGCRAGPWSHISNLFHEMGHLAEREIPKLIRRPGFAWGYYFGVRWEALGRSGYEPVNDKAVQREIRVWAYNLSLLRHYAVNLSAEELTKSAQYLGLGFWIYQTLVAPKDQYPDLDYYQHIQVTLKILAEHVEKLSEVEYSFEKFKSAWQERMQALTSTPAIP